MARTHAQVRLRKPANGAYDMRTVYRNSQRRLARELWPLARETCNDIRNLLRRHRSTIDVAAPVRCPQLGPACNHYGSKLLVTHQGEVRAIHNRAGLAPSAAVRSMTREAVRSICIGATLRIARSRRCLGWRSRIAERIGLHPRSNSSHKSIDLPVSEHSTRTLCKSWHRSAGHSVGGEAANPGCRGN